MYDLLKLKKQVENEHIQNAKRTESDICTRNSVALENKTRKKKSQQEKFVNKQKTLSKKDNRRGNQMVLSPSRVGMQERGEEKKWIDL